MSQINVALVPCLTDNYAYLIWDGSGLCTVVDPSEPEPVRRALAEHGLKLTHILNTHHHLDHCGGNLALKEQFSAQVVGPGKDRERIPGIDVGVGQEAPWNFGAHTVRVLEIPAHTRSHVAFVFDGFVFTGDTLFAMGCGRLFEGTPAMMWASLSKLMLLPDTTKIYCGHEYTLSNGRFALTMEPENVDLQVRMREIQKLRDSNQPTIPSTMGLEKKTNPFLRPHSLEIRAKLNMKDADTIAVFGKIRKRKDNF
jgi:hydroxyacylglutathione hydrolase